MVRKDAVLTATAQVVNEFGYYHRGPNALVNRKGESCISGEVLKKFGVQLPDSDARLGPITYLIQCGLSGEFDKGAQDLLERLAVLNDADRPWGRAFELVS